ncbi:MAG TPA: DNA replication/repair protein RecF [Acidimicrobiales bacterium]|nr:DNA replication/repair protein RecF [Acidimicrobiales bacterium]
MQVRTLWLTDFRSYTSAQLDLSPGLTALVGANGEGKTNLLEALAWLATLSSFRGAPTEALVRRGAPFAVVRALAEREGRELLIEAQIQLNGRNRVLVNRQPLRRARDLLGSLRVSVFTPDDLAIVKDGPGERRRFLDDALVSLHPRNDALRGAVDKVLRQRNALLKQAGGRLDESSAFTLDVWDAKLAEAGGALAAARLDLLDRMRPVLAATYDALARRPALVQAAYDAAWAARPAAAGAAPPEPGPEPGSVDGAAGSPGAEGRRAVLTAALAGSLTAARRDDVRRGVSTVGPHRDDLALSIGGAPARTQASQGEQRTLALALRLAAHDVVTADSGTAPVLLLDDVFSELDPDRSAALLANLPTGQTLLTTASTLPADAHPDVVLRLVGGEIRR